MSQFPQRSRHSSFSLEPIKNVVDSVRRRSSSVLDAHLVPRFRRNSSREDEDVYDDNCETSVQLMNTVADTVVEESNQYIEANQCNGDAMKTFIFYEKPKDECKEELVKIHLPMKVRRSISLEMRGQSEGDGDDNNNQNLSVVEDGGIAPSVAKDYEKENETPFKAMKQLLIPFLIAGLGNVATGYILIHVKDWRVFNEIPQLIILVPALLGLKGNVEMTLASRLSTHANLGDLDHPSKRRQIIIGNMALVQCQASTVGFIAPFISLALSYLNPDENDDHVLTAQEIVLLSASSVITANIANLLLGTVMCCVVVFSRKYKVNPDNIATPIAASLGDFTTMILLSYISHFLFENIHLQYVPTVSLAVLLLLIPVWGHIARTIRFTHQIILTGWIPIISAMLLQNTGGLIMEGALDKFKRLAAFQPVINGVGGNLVAVHSSRMSTYLHQNVNVGQLPANDPNVCVSPAFTFCGPTSQHSTMARLLLYLSAPSHLFFLVIIKVLRPTFHLTALFLVVYLTAAVTQVAVLLQLAYFLVHYMWRRGVDPDNNVIPFLTAFADLIGSGLLAIAFFVLFALGDENAFNATNVTSHVQNATLSNATGY